MSAMSNVPTEVLKAVWPKLNRRYTPELWADVTRELGRRLTWRECAELVTSDLTAIRKNFLTA
ncbi:MAG: hypothetical protein FWC60_07260 [Firmicutes bacterium]|nr:hypothetical protein [Bacillota bacterium]